MGRALAGALMVVNHAGVRWFADVPSPTASIEGLVFAGSLAPVLFFTLAGLGRGVQAARKSQAPFTSTLSKAALLSLADVALWLAPGHHVGLDFLGFIALSAVAVELVARTPHPTRTALGGMLGVLGLRYALSPALHLSERHDALGNAWHLMAGDGIVAGVSYPMAPWLAFPLLGFVLGRATTRHAAWLEARRGLAALVCALTATCGFGICLGLRAREMIFFRWGNMSLAYCVLSFAAVAATLALVLAAARTLPPSAQKALSLQGPASLALVPLHYAVVGALASLAPGWVQDAFGLVIACSVVGTLAMARTIIAPMQAFAAWLVRSGLTRPAMALIPLSLTPLLWLQPGLWRSVVSTFVQLLACSIFLLRSQRLAPAPILRQGVSALPLASTSSQNR